MNFSEETTTEELYSALVTARNSGINEILDMCTAAVKGRYSMIFKYGGKTLSEADEKELLRLYSENELILNLKMMFETLKWVEEDEEEGGKK